MLQKVAAKTGFYKRVCDLTPAMFFELLLLCASDPKNRSLEYISTKAEEFYGVSISKQAIDERFTEDAVKFVKEVLACVIENEINKVVDGNFLSTFNHVRIKDSTKFNIPSKLAEYYKGNGGNVKKLGGICIQYEYDVKSGKILNLEIASSKITDSCDASATKDNVFSGDLIIRDLGYYSIKVFQSFIESKAFFLSRLNMSTDIYDCETDEKIDFKKLYKMMDKNGLTKIEKLVNVSSSKVEVRIIIERVPEKVYQQRLKNHKNKRRGKGYKISDDYKSRCQLNMFITNVGSEELSAEQVVLAYRLRWQVELMFKNWKSTCSIDKIQSMKYERYTCLLLTRLATIVLKSLVIWNIQYLIYQTSKDDRKKLLSLHKCFEGIEEHFLTIVRERNFETETIKQVIEHLAKLFSKNHWKEKRKNSTNLIDIIHCLSNI